MKIDIGAGTRPREGFEACDKIAFEGVKHVFDAGADRWPFEDGTVEEVHASHFLEHLTAYQRCHFFNELDRVLKSGGRASIICPHWGSNRAYGDPTHQWPPVGEMTFQYLNREWRESQAPHTDKKYNPDGYSCNLAAVWGYGMHPAITTRNQEYQQYAMQWYREAVQDIHVNITKP